MDLQKNKSINRRNRHFSSLFHFNTFSVVREYVTDIFSNKALRILVLTNSIILLASAMIGPIYAMFVDIVGGDLMDASLAGGVFSLAAGITVLVAGKYSDKSKEPELIVVIGYIIMGIGFLLYLFVNSVWLLFLVQVIVGFGDAIYNPAFDALYSRHIEVDKSGSQWGAWEAMNYFTAAVGAIIGGLVAKNFGFAPLFVIMSLLCFSSALYVYMLPRKVL